MNSVAAKESEKYRLVINDGEDHYELYASRDMAASWYSWTLKNGKLQLPVSPVASVEQAKDYAHGSLSAYNTHKCSDECAAAWEKLL